MQVEGRQRATLTSALAGRTIVVDTDRSVVGLIDALALEDAVISAEGRRLLEMMMSSSSSSSSMLRATGSAFVRLVAAPP